MSPVAHFAATLAANLAGVLDARTYRALQRALAPGGETSLRAQLAVRVARVARDASAAPRAARALDVGCGDASLLHGLDVPPVIGVDLAHARLRALGEGAVRADATALPFPDACFDIAFSCGLLHHLDDAAALAALAELCRVTVPGGQVIVFDAVRPASVLRAPLAAMLRAADRGRHVRGESRMRALVSAARPAWPWQFERVRYAASGLEGVWCVAPRPVER